MTKRGIIGLFSSLLVFATGMTGGMSGARADGPTRAMMVNVANGLCMELSGVSPGTIATFAQCDQSKPGQFWDFYPAYHGYSQIATLLGGCMYNDGGPYAKNAGDCTSNQNQQWRFSSEGSLVRLTSRPTGFTLGSAPGRDVVLVGNFVDPNQSLWRIDWFDLPSGNG